MKSIMFVTKSQYGYQVDYYNHIQNLKSKYKIFYISYDYGERKFEEDSSNVKLFYINYNSSKRHKLLFVLKLVLKTRELNPGNIVVSNMFGAVIIRLLNLDKNVLLDIRSMSVSSQPIKRIVQNFMTIHRSLYFQNVLVVSESLREKYFKFKKNCHVVTVGGNYAERRNELFSDAWMKVVYVGTLSGRRIEDTVHGLSEVCKRTNVKIRYTIIGSGDIECESKLNEAIRSCNSENLKISYVGYIPNKDVARILVQQDIGVVYVPMCPFYEYQPSTKLFEYHLSGLVVIATKTFENVRFINSKNGVLVSDNSAEFADGIDSIISLRDSYSCREIQNIASIYSWENIAIEFDSRLS